MALPTIFFSFKRVKLKNLAWNNWDFSLLEPNIGWFFILRDGEIYVVIFNVLILIEKSFKLIIYLILYYLFIIFNNKKKKYEKATEIYVYVYSYFNLFSIKKVFIFCCRKMKKYKNQGKIMKPLKKIKKLLIKPSSLKKATNI